MDAWLGRQTRAHGDVDIAVFRDNERAIFEHLEGWRLVAHDTADATHDEPWDGRRLGFLAHGTPNAPAHLHGTHPGFEFALEVLVNERSGGDWLFSREPRVAMPASRSMAPAAWGVPIAVPEVLLFYKATAYFGMEGMKERPQDEVDFLALLPLLSGAQREWLEEAVSLLRAGHPWLGYLVRCWTPPPAVLSRGWVRGQGERRWREPHRKAVRWLQYSACRTIPLPCGTNAGGNRSTDVVCVGGRDFASRGRKQWRFRGRALPCSAAWSKLAGPANRAGGALTANATTRGIRCTARSRSSIPAAGTSGRFTQLRAS